MILTFTSDFDAWASSDANLISLHTSSPSSFLFNAHVLNKLRLKGFSADSLVTLYSALKPAYTVGAAHFSKIRILIWYWSNGDQIIFPINSNNSVYLGNDSADWLCGWPFLVPNFSQPNSYLLRSLPFYKLPIEYSQPFLLITGQPHFGHFVLNQLIALRDLSTSYPHFQSLNFLHPPGYSPFHLSLLSNYAFLNPPVHASLPSQSGIYELHNVICPAIGDNSFGLVDSKGSIESNLKNRPVMPGKYIYSTRGNKFDHDRLINYHDLIAHLKAYNFDIVNPSSLSFDAKLSLYGDAELVISDSGTCWLNSALFSNKYTSNVNFFPSSVLKTSNNFALNQLPMNLGLFLSNSMLPLDIYSSDASNPWYDICYPPDLNMIQSLVKQG